MSLKELQKHVVLGFPFWRTLLGYLLNFGTCKYVMLAAFVGISSDDTFYYTILNGGTLALTNFCARMFFFQINDCLLDIFFF